MLREILLEKKMASNKRKSERIDFEEMVQVYTLSPIPSGNPLKSPNPPILLKGKNISKDGICLENLGNFIAEGTYQLDFQFFKDKTIHTFAKVVWSGKNACGLHFLKPEEVINLQWGLEYPEEAKLSNHSNPLAS
jgi:hypothetical protein